MKQALLKKGKVFPVELPEPTVKAGHVKIKVFHSCISAGTEVSGVTESRKSIIKKAIDNPQKIVAAIAYYKDQGLNKTKEKINIVADSYSESGYSISGKIVEVGSNAFNFAIGDLVAAGGMRLAVHAEYVVVPINLVVKIPDGLDTKYASTGTVGSIALQGVRRADLKLGEFGVVFGVGLLGLITVQLLKSAGIRVACVDLNQKRLELAQKLGAEIVINSSIEDPINAIKNWTGGYGTDAVIFTAATSSNQPLSQSFKMTRKKGKVVLVGVSGMTIDRNDIYVNEIDFLISTSYGPGRYDENYELKGLDYPYSYIRWTENRNIGEFLRLIKEGMINLDIFNPSVYKFEDISKAFVDLEEDPDNKILAIIEYLNIDQEKKNKISYFKPENKVGAINVGIIGAGSYVGTTLLPIISNMAGKFIIHTIVNRGGKKAFDLADRFKSANISNEIDDVIKCNEIDLVIITTRHGNHADLVLQCLEAGKNVFVEKPLATSFDQLNRIKEFYKDGIEGKPILIVGFNRRFSDYVTEAKKCVKERINPLFIRYRMNAGYSPIESWVHEDGGRIVGEACHIIDLMMFLTESNVESICTTSLSPTNGTFTSFDNKSITLKFKDGSVAVIDYFSNGSKDLEKEMMEIHFDMKSIIIKDYKSIEGYGIKVSNINSKVPKKGQSEEWKTIYNVLREGKKWPISFENLIDTTEISLEIINIE